MNHLFTASIFVAIAMALSVPSPAVAQNFPPSVTQKIHAAQKQVITIGLEEYRKVVESPGEALIIDVREPQEFAAGHVPGAVNIPRGLVEFRIWKQVGFPANPDTNRLSTCNAKTATARPSRPSHLRSWGSPIPRPS